MPEFKCRQTARRHGCAFWSEHFPLFQAAPCAIALLQRSVFVFFPLPSLSSNGEWAAHLGGNEQVTATEKVSWLPFLLFCGCIISSWLQGRVGCPSPLSTHTHIHTWFLVVPVLIICFPLRFLSLQSAPTEDQVSMSRYALTSWDGYFGELMNILFFTLERVNILVLCKL